MKENEVQACMTKVMIAIKFYFINVLSLDDPCSFSVSKFCKFICLSNIKIILRFEIYFVPCQNKEKEKKRFRKWQSRNYAISCLTHPPRHPQRNIILMFVLRIHKDFIIFRKHGPFSSEKLNLQQSCIQQQQVGRWSIEDHNSCWSNAHTNVLYCEHLHDYKNF